MLVCCVFVFVYVGVIGGDGGSGGRGGGGRTGCRRGGVGLPRAPYHRPQQPEHRHAPPHRVGTALCALRNSSSSLIFNPSLFAESIDWCARLQLGFSAMPGVPGAAVSDDATALCVRGFNSTFHGVGTSVDVKEAVPQRRPSP